MDGAQPQRAAAVVAVLVGLAALASPAPAAPLPSPTSLDGTWEVAPADADAPGPPPGDEAPWQATTVPSVWDPAPSPATFGGGARWYRLRFPTPAAPPGYGWSLRFEQVRRQATVWLNGKRLGSNPDPYTPFAFKVGLRSEGPNELLVHVSNRLHGPVEGWWNWGGIVRTVRLEPLAPTRLEDLALLPVVRCGRRGRRCRARLVVDGRLVQEAGGRPAVSVALRSPGGRLVRRRFAPREGRVRLSFHVRRPRLWSPRRPALYEATVVVRAGGEATQIEQRRVGLRSVSVRRGLLHLNGRRLRLRGASIHEDVPGRGPVLADADFEGVVRELRALRANVTRSHYPLDHRLLERLDREGIMVWSQAPVWHRDRFDDRLDTPSERAAAVGEVRRTVRETRNHPSVIVHSVADELSPRPDRRRTTALFMRAAAKAARHADPTLPVAVDLAGRQGRGPQRTYRNFDALGVNQYFGWYPWVGPLRELAPYLRRLRRGHRRQALVVTEFGAEGIPELATAERTRLGSWGYQADYARRMVRVLRRQRYLSGLMWWTLREFAIYPGWSGGVPPEARGLDNVLHNKGLLTYEGARKPAWHVIRRGYASMSRRSP